MPVYDYRCKTCGHEFTETHPIEAPLPDCPECESVEVQRLITSAPTIARGILTPAGTSRKSSKEELKAKWREETPKLREELAKKLGEEAIKDIPSLNMPDND
jgi:putative FmdB family regulatory protein